MNPVRTLGCVAASAAVALAIGCSKSPTGPTDPFVGSWTVSITNLIQFQPADTGNVAPFTLTIAKNGQTYTASFPTMTWAAGAQLQFPASSAGQSSIQFLADTLVIQDDATAIGPGCLFYYSAAFTGARSVQGYAWIACNGNETALGQLTATKQ
jgi:hypothetical protein